MRLIMAAHKEANAPVPANHHISRLLWCGVQYVSEAVISIVEANVKGKDVSAAAKVGTYQTSARNTSHRALHAAL